jgi:hypothetical protein
MADSNQRLANKVNVLRQQIENDELAKFQHGLVVQDYATLPTNASQDVKDRLLGPKKAAELEITLCDQRLSVRAPLLAELEKQLEASTAKPAAS